MTAPHTTDADAAGSNILTERAVTRIVAAAAASVPGTATVERIAGRSHPRFDVMIDDRSRSASIEAHIAVTWPSPVTAVAEAVRSTVTRRVREMTGLRVEHVNVVVGPVEADGRRVTREEIDAARLPEPRPVRARELAVRQPAIRPAVVDGHLASRLTGGELDEVTARELPRPASVDLPPAPREEPISVAEGPAEVPVRVAEPAPLTPVTVGEGPAEVPIRVPRERPLREVQLPPGPRLAPVRIPPAPRPAPVRVNPLQVTTHPRPALESKKGGDHGRVR